MTWVYRAKELGEQHRCDVPGREDGFPNGEPGDIWVCSVCERVWTIAAEDNMAGAETYWVRKRFRERHWQRQARLIENQRRGTRELYE